MATIDTYKLKIDVEGAGKVEDLKDSLQDVGSAFQKAAAAGAAAFSALGVSAIRLADDLVDLADATGISAAKIYQLSAATEAAGGKFENGGKLLQAFSRELEGIEKGSESTIEGLQKLGISGSELENLSDEQLFNAVVNGLANMDNGFQKTALAMQFFGKEAASIDFKTLAQELNKTIDPNLDARLRSAADAVRSIEEAYRNLQLAALEAFAPVISAIGELNFDIESARKAIQILGALIAGAFAASVVVQIAKVVELIKKLALAIRAAGTAQAFLTGLTGVGLIAVAASAAAATAAYVALGKAMEDAVDTKKELEGGDIATPGAPAPQGPQRQRGKTDAEKQLDAVKATTVELQKQNTAALEYERVINGTIGLSQEIAEIKRIDAQLEQDRARSAANYEKQIQVLKADTSKNNQAQIAELQKQQKLADEQLVAMAALKKEAVDRNLAERQNSTELQKQLGLIQERAQANVAALQAEQMRKVIAGEITQEEANNIIAVNRIREEGLAKIDQLEKQIASERDTVRKQDLQNQLDATRRATDFAISEKQREIEEKKALEESYAAGAVKALESIAEAFKPYKMAQDAIQKTWGRIGDAVDKFVETGKFKFSDFARSVLQDLAKMIAKAMIFKAINAALGAFGISIPGLAKGGKATEGQPYIVGEKGPELFVPGETGTVVPTDKLKELLKPLQDQIISEDVARNIAMINQQMSTMANDTSAVVAKPKPIDSMPKLFAPKAPDTIIPNKLPEPTVVESEDKMLNAPVTNNYNTYNINALDAKSVAQLFAENRKAIFGANKMAEREMSYAGVR